MPKTMNRSWIGWPRSTSPKRREWCAHVSRMRPSPHDASPSVPGTSSGNALIKLSSVASDIFGVSGRAMIEALIAGERDPGVLAEMAKGRMRPKRAALLEALTGRFDDHHAEPARMLLDQVDALNPKIEALYQPHRRADRRHPRGSSTGRRWPRQRPRPGGVVDRRPPRRDRWDRRSRRSGHHRRGRVWTWPSSPPPHTSCRGPSCRRAPSSPDRGTDQVRPARATPTSKACSAKQRLAPPRPTPSWATAPRPRRAPTQPTPGDLLVRPA